MTGDEGIYVEYWAPLTPVGPEELWELGVQVGVQYAGGLVPSEPFHSALVPVSLPANKLNPGYQYNPISYEGDLNPDSTIWRAPMSTTMLTSGTDAYITLGVGNWFTGVGAGVVRVYGGAAYARRLA